MKTKPLHDLQSFVDLLRDEGELLVIEEEVDPYLEIAEIHRRVIERQGPALLFTRVKGSAFPVITNLFGTARRLDLAFGRKPQDFVKDIVHLAETIMPPTPAKLWQNRNLFLEASRIGLKQIKNAPILENCQRPPRLGTLPMLTSWHSDGGPFVTLPLVYTEHPESGAHNLGMYRIQRHSETTTGIHWQIHKGGGYHYFEAEQQQSTPAPDPLYRRPAGPDARSHCPAARRYPRVDAHLTAAGRQTADGPRPAAAGTGWLLRPSLRSKASSLRTCVTPRDRLAIITAITHWNMITRSFRSPTSTIATRQSTRPPWSAARARRIFSSATISRTCSRHFSRW